MLKIYLCSTNPHSMFLQRRYLPCVLLILSVIALLQFGCQQPSNPDTDNDGIPDRFEKAGELYLGLPLHAWGARPGVTDLFIEIDYMDSTNNGILPTDEGMIPNQDALQRIVTLFAQQGINVHFDVGDLFDQSGDNQLNPEQMDLGGGSEVPYVHTMNNSEFLNNYRSNYLADARKSIFYYFLFAKFLSGNNAAWAGQANPYTVLAMAKFGLDNNTYENQIKLKNKQALVTMHALGHNLGLQHGGAFSILDYKPNYLSIMNSLYTSDLGLPLLATADEAHRYYFVHSERNTDPCATLVPPWNTLPNNIYSTSFRIDFSHGNNAQIDEGNVDETAGLGTNSGIAVDFNCDNNINANLGAYDVTSTGSIFNDVLNDHDDWSNLLFYFGLVLGNAVATGNENAINVGIGDAAAKPISISNGGAYTIGGEPEGVYDTVPHANYNIDGSIRESIVMDSGNVN